MADSSSNDSTSGGPWSQRGFVAAAAFLGIVIVAAVGILLIGPGDSGDSGGGTRPQGGNNGKPGASADPAASVCGLKPGGQEIPETPPDAKWAARREGRCSVIVGRWACTKRGCPARLLCPFADGRPVRGGQLRGSRVACKCG